MINGRRYVETGVLLADTSGVKGDKKFIIPLYRDISILEPILELTTEK